MDYQEIIIQNQLSLGFLISKEVILQLHQNLSKVIQLLNLEYFESKDFSLTLRGINGLNNEELAIRINYTDQQESQKITIMNQESDKNCLYQFHFKNATVRIFNLYDYIYADQEINETQLINLMECNLKYVRSLSLSYIPQESIEKIQLGQYISHCYNLEKLKLKLQVSTIFNENSQLIKMIKNISNFPKLNDLMLDIQDFQVDFSFFYTHLSKLKNLKKVQLSFYCRGNQVEGILNLLSCQSRLFNLVLNFKGIIQIEQAKQIGHVLSKLEELQSLNLNLENTKVPYEIYENIINSLGCCTKLNDLTLNFYGNGFPPNHQVNRSREKNKLMFSEIQQLTLDIGLNKINKLGVEDLADNISKCKKLKSLKLNLQRVVVGDCLTFEAGFQLAQIIGQSIQKCSLLENLNLNLLYNGIRSEGIKLLSRGLKDCQNLKVLILILGNNNIDDNEGLQEFSQNISKLINIEKLVLDFNGNKFNHIKTTHLSEGLSFLYQIKELSLKFNHSCIGVEGAQSIGKSLGLLQNLQFLNLQIQKNKVTDSGLISLGQGLKQTKNLKILNIYLLDNQISEFGLESFFSNLSSLKHLYYLSLNLIQNQYKSELLFNRRESSLFKLLYIRQLFIFINFHKDIEIFRISLKKLPRLILGQLYY
ncbi:hypothetical protein TTHERM_000716179 (macronuclear) [Tetrahymena thermophila SB210]|uniref:Kinase domain protein n=1 Tax=Tetrahymena thermophila (strain SB210) TaxID=312017 RepID=W7XDD5_TETTS|nr:hypothetical protein TTHERM_000716179 [Tetrahymena thermophila SB210]EWS71821.1 hypothetical protein TTHERM_000716179 [Tetrahymena thermophila SB210]|eukprot:XP_012655643.1 hypothetical protein TTHERM_000716179 [Tetrahymena thermophila SB210]